MPSTHIPRLSFGATGNPPTKEHAAFNDVLEAIQHRVDTLNAALVRSKGMSTGALSFRVDSNLSTNQITVTSHTPCREQKTGAQSQSRYAEIFITINNVGKPYDFNPNGQVTDFSLMTSNWSNGADFSRDTDSQFAGIDQFFQTASLPQNARGNEIGGATLTNEDICSMLTFYTGYTHTHQRATKIPPLWH